MNPSNVVGVVISVAVMVGDEGLPIDVDEVQRRGMVHQKVGIFRDFEGNELAFDGSINETASAWNLNLEQFKVFRGWCHGEKDFFHDDVSIFSSLWQNERQPISAGGVSRWAGAREFAHLFHSVVQRDVVVWEDTTLAEWRYGPEMIE